jgi:hypothetical protein
MLQVFKSMPNITQPVSQQQPVHTQTQVQECKRKNKTSTRIIDETTLRIYFPRNPNADLLSATVEPLRSTFSSSIDQDRATSTQGPPLLSIGFSPSLSTILRCYMIYLDTFCLNFVDLPDENTSCDANTVMEGYGTFPMGPETAGVGGIMSNDTHQWISR